MGGHAARRSDKQKSLEKLDLARRVGQRTLAKQKPLPKAKKSKRN